MNAMPSFEEAMRRTAEASVVVSASALATQVADVYSKVTAAIGKLP